MTVSISRMSIQYYLASVAAGDGTGQQGPRKLTSYYTESGDPAGTWFGSGVTAAGLASGSQVTQRDAVSVFEELVHPVTGEPLGKRPLKTTTAPTGAKTPKGQAAAPTREGVAGFDLTFSVPKSVSVLWAMADAPTQAKIHTAHQDAVRACLEWAEQNVIQSRAGEGGVVKTPVNGIIASLFDHFDSRDGDPQLHTHAVVSNRVQRTSDGAWVTLDSYTLHRWVVTVSEMYNAALYDRLADYVGAVAEQRDPYAYGVAEQVSERNRRVELAGVPDSLIEEFSSRSRAINARTLELIQAWEEEHGRAAPADLVFKLRQQATLDTRQSKPVDKLPLSTRWTMWQEQAVNRGVSPEHVVQQATGRTADIFRPADFSEAAVSELAEHALRRAAQKHPTFTRANVAAAVHRMLATTRFPGLDERLEVTDRITNTALESAVALTPERHRLDHLTQDGLSIRGHSVFDSPETSLYTTTETLEVEQALMRATTTPADAGLPDAAAVHQVLHDYRSAKGYGLAPDQLAAAERVVTDSATISAIIGPAGTGKTTTLSGVRAAWEASRGEGSVIGLAPSAAAAQVLGEELGIATDNVAKWLYESAGDGAAARAQRYQELTTRIADLERRQVDASSDPILRNQLDAARTRLANTIAEQSKYELREGQVLIVDEASMASTADLHQLHAQVQAVGAKMLLIGDPHQLEAVDAGGFLGWMENTDRAAVLTSVWRFSNDWEAENSLAMRRGDDACLETLDEHDRIRSSDDALDSAYRAWAADVAAGKSSVLIAGRNDAVDALNTRAQSERIAVGELDTSISAPVRGHHDAYVGDLVLARVNNRRLTDETGSFVKNGTRMRVTSITAEDVTAVREDTGAPIRLPKAYMEANVELGYAATSHRAQGLTVDTSHVAVDETFGREQLYVGLTRGREANLVHIAEPAEQTETPAADPWGMMRQKAPESVMAELRGVLAKSNVDRTAHEVRDAEHGWANDLGRYLSEAEYVTGLAATRRVHEWVRSHTVDDPAAAADTPEMREAIKLCRVHDLDPEQVIPTQTQDLTSALPALRQAAQQAPTGPDLMPRTTHATEDEKAALEAITSAAARRIEQIKHTHEGQSWLSSTNVRYGEAADAVIQWRALSGQDDAETPLGSKPPAESRKLTETWNRLNQILSNAEAVDVRQFQDWTEPDPQAVPDPAAPDTFEGHGRDLPDWQHPDTPSTPHQEGPATA